MSSEHRTPSRRGFLRLVAIAAGGALLGCDRSRDRHSGHPTDFPDGRKRPKVDASGRWRVTRRIVIPGTGEAHTGDDRAPPPGVLFAFDDGDQIVIDEHGQLVAKLTAAEESIDLTRDGIERRLGTRLEVYEQVLNPDSLAFRYGYTDARLFPERLDYRVDLTLGPDGRLVGVATLRTSAGLGRSEQVTTSELALDLLELR